MPRRRPMEIFEADLSAAADVARLMSALNSAVGPVYGLPATPENTVVTAKQARQRMEAMASVERVLLADVDGERIGLLSLRIVPYLSQDVPYAEVTELFVSETHRRRGIAKAMIERAEQIAREARCTLIHMNAWHNNDAAKDFYRSAGFDAVEVGFKKLVR